MLHCQVIRLLAWKLGIACIRWKRSDILSFDCGLTENSNIFTWVVNLTFVFSYRVLFIIRYALQKANGTHTICDMCTACDSLPTRSTYLAITRHFPEKIFLHIACNSRQSNKIFGNKMPLGTGYCHCTQDITVTCLSHCWRFNTFTVVCRTHLFHILLASVQRLFFNMSITIGQIHLPSFNTNSPIVTHWHIVIP